ncbi:MAG: AbrB/MazE/SpoVT family DNA-binding domain-containing protein [Bryobacterales bacterium]|nr:AbrB/MazE/SpoVT family DNA-binding domain-containing protein [Bryobacterales bacterium]
MQVTMSAEGEIRIPKEMRELLALDAGTELELSVLGSVW